MIVLQAQNVSKAFGDKQVLKRANLVVNEKERLGLVGVNGSGKTTLLKCLTGQVAPDQGEISLASARSLACLEQISEAREGATAWDAVMDSYAELINLRRVMHELEIKMGLPGSDLQKTMDAYAQASEAYEQANGYACETTARRILSGLGFNSDEYNKPLEVFSGGQKTRLNLGRLLAQAPDILLLDEPTNHLDVNSVEWLEDFIKNYTGTVVLVSHDRMFLDRVANRIVELQSGQLRSYPGNYSNYIKMKASEDLTWQRAYQKQQEYIQRTEDYIRRFKAGIKSKQARGRQSQLERLERIEAPTHEHKLRGHQMSIRHESGHDVLVLENISKAFNKQPVLKDINLKVEKGEKLALIGPNGCGKTTLLKIISSKIPPDHGTMRLGSRVQIAYFSQEYENLQPDNTILEEIMHNFDLTLEEARSALGTMLFSGDDVFKQVRDLSGGERGRLSILKLLLSGANFLLLDEPTNHLDIESRQAVEDMLSYFTGTLLLVSHDRYFIDQVAERIIAIEDGNMEYYWGNYSYYHEKLQEKKSLVEAQRKEIKQKNQLPELLAKEEEKARKRVQRAKQKELEELEAEIEAIEKQKAIVETFLADPTTYSDEERARNYTLEYKQLDKRLVLAYEKWEQLSEA